MKELEEYFNKVYEREMNTPKKKYINPYIRIKQIREWKKQ